MHSERITYLATADQKAALEAFAKERGESVGNVVRAATARFIGQPTEEEEAELTALIEQVSEAIPKMNASIDRMIEKMEKSQRETEAFLRKMGVR